MCRRSRPCCRLQREPGIVLQVTSVDASKLEVLHLVITDEAMERLLAP